MASWSCIKQSIRRTIWLASRYLGRTKEIRSVNEQYSQLAEEYYSKTNDFVQPEVSQSSIRNSTMWILPPVALSMLLAVFTLIFGKNAVALSTRKNRFLKLMGVLFCILLMLVVFLPLVQTPSASNVGIIWGPEVRMQ